MTLRPLSALALPAVFAAMLASAAAANAATYDFIGASGNDGIPPDLPVYAFGQLPAGTSTFTATNFDYIPFPVGSNHPGGNSYSFSLAADAKLTFTVNPNAGIIDIVYVSVNYPKDSPLYNSCCEIYHSNNGFNNPDPSAPITFGLQLAAGSYGFYTAIDYPSAPPGTPSYTSQSYTGAITVSPTSGAPEPGAWALMLIGLAGLGASLRARRRPAYG